MKIFNKIKDHFKKADFSVAPNKKLKTISKEFKDNFGVSLVFYKGKKIAEPTLTLNQLNKKVSDKIITKDASLKIKASMKVGDVEKLFKENFGVTVQIKDKSATKLVPNEITIGDASRENY